MAAQLDAIKAFIASHETLSPPNPGTWSILRSIRLPPAFERLLESCSKDTINLEPSTKAELIRVLLEWLAIWDVRRRPFNLFTATSSRS
ncbi:hypothetical protein RQP46_002255 [Phenoliferia psychrophenolica]